MAMKKNGTAIEAPSGASSIGETDYLVFALDELRYALPLSAVERVIRAVEITPLPKAPPIVLGVINVQGSIIPVVDVRARFRLPAREMSCDDRFILAHTPRRGVALVVDSVGGIRELGRDALADTERTLSFTEYLHGVAVLEDGLVLINNLDQFLSLDEEGSLDEALTDGAG